MGRGFEIVIDEHRQNYEVANLAGKQQKVYYDINLPVRSDDRSAGYDFYLPKDITINPNERIIIWSDVKAYMEDDEVLKIYPRSSTAINNGIIITNIVGIIDASYYGNEKNDGNIAYALWNTTGRGVRFKAGERIAQGIFQKYLLADKDQPKSDKRTGGIGSSGK